MEKELLNTFDKELLLKDLCARLPYGVKVAFLNEDLTYHSEPKTLIGIECINNLNYSKLEDEDGNTTIIEFVKPYLFPLSDMTEKQYESLKELGILDNCSHSYEHVNPYIHGVSFIFKEFKTYSLELIEWLNKNNFDYRGLIPKGLAIDATNKNIY